MMSGKLDRRLHGPCARLGAMLAVVVLSFSVVAAHGPLAGGHMGAAMGKAMTICLAVMQGVVVVYGTRRIRRVRKRRTASRYASPPAPPLAPRAYVEPLVAFARAGPERLQVFRL